GWDRVVRRVETPCSGSFVTAPSQCLISRMLRGSFQLRPVPFRQVGSGFVSALQEFDQRRSGRGIKTNIVIHQKEFFHLRMVKRLARTDPTLPEARRFRGGVSVECRTFDLAAARPESCADHFVRISLARDQVGSLALRSAPPGKARDAQVETTPKEVDGAVLAKEA